MSIELLKQNIARRKQDANARWERLKERPALSKDLIPAVKELAENEA